MLLLIRDEFTGFVAYDQGGVAYCFDINWFVAYFLLKNQLVEKVVAYKRCL